MGNVLKLLLTSYATRSVLALPSYYLLCNSFRNKDYAGDVEMLLT